MLHYGYLTKIKEYNRLIVREKKEDKTNFQPQKMEDNN
jgi:hypothetical protein